MSLLLDALQRAGQEKASVQGAPGSWDTRRGPPLTSAAADPNFDLSEAPTHVGPLPTPVYSPKMAQQLLRATQAPPSRWRGAAPIIGSVGALVVLAALASYGLGFWSLGGPVAAVPEHALVVNVATVQAPLLAPTASPSVASGASVSAAEPPLVQTHAQPPLPQRHREVMPARPLPVRSASAGASTATSIAGSAVAPRFAARTAGAGVLESAYAALKASHFDEATARYNEVLQAQPEQRDALLGLAYIADQAGQREQARRLYERVLRQDPDHPVALAGLLGLDARTDLAQATSRSRDVAERHPESAPALAALGGLLVKEGRLADAQVAFAKAQALEPTQAAYAYNLAVALDRLHQYLGAQAAYERALALADAPTGSPEPGFSRAAVRQRLDQLRSSTGRQP